MVTTRGLPRRDRDPPRHKRRPVGRLQGRRAALHPPPRPASRSPSASTTPGGSSSELDEDEAREVARVLRPARRRDRRGLLHQRVRQPRPRAAHARDPARGARRASASRPPARSCRRSSSTSASPPRSPTRCSRRWSAATCSGSATQLEEGGYARRPAAPALRRRRDDAAHGRALRRPPRRLGHRRGRDRLPPHRRSCAASRTRSASTWAAPAPTSRSSTRASAQVTKEWYVEYGYPICFPSIEVLTIGAGGGSLAWIDEAGSLRNGPQSAGADPGPGLLRARRRRADEHRRQPRARPARHRADRRRHGARPRRRRAGAIRDNVAEPLGLDAMDAARRGHRGRQREHGRRGAPDLDPPRLRPARLRARRLRRRRPAARRGARPRAARSRPCSCRRTRASPRRSAACSSTSGTTSSAMYLGQADEADTAEVEEAFARARGRGARAARGRGRAPRTAWLPRFDRHALPRPVALAVGRRSSGRSSRSTAASTPSTPSTSASTTTAATTRRSRSTGSACAPSA